MNRDINAYITLFFKGVTINKLGTLKYNEKSSCVFSIFPHHHSISLIKSIADNIINLSKTISGDTGSLKYEDAFALWTKFLDDLNDSTYGLFVDSPIKIPLTYEIPRWYGKDRTNETNTLMTKVQAIVTESQNSIDTLYDVIMKLKPLSTGTVKKASEKKKKVEAPAAATGGSGLESPNAAAGGAGAPEPESEEEEEPPAAVIKVKTKAEKAAEHISLLLEHSEDFDPTKWSEQIRHAEAILKGLPVEIKKLTDELAESFDFAKRGKINKLQKELDNYPDYLKALKENSAAKQNYYNDGYQSKYAAFKKAVMTLCNDPEKNTLLKNDGTAPNNIQELIIKPLTTPEALVHFARSPALRDVLSKFVTQAQTDVNRKRLNKAVLQANVNKGHVLLTRVSTKSDETRDYFVTDIWH